MRKPHLFIRKLKTIDALPTCAILVRDVSTLHHEFRQYSVENVALVRQVCALFSCAETSEVLNCFGHLAFEKLKHYPAFGVLSLSLAIFRAHFKIKIDLRIAGVKLG